MPRYRRLIAEGSVQHVISRFINSEFRFDASGARTEYLRRACAALSRSDWRPIAYALMSSHVHWAMRAGLRPSSTVIKPLHAGFAGWLNARQARHGPVFADRHRTLTFDAKTAAALLAYIHNNPVRAGVVDDPADSTWTSHRAYLGLAPEPPWLDVKLGLALCGFSATPSGRLAFHEMVVARAAEARCIAISGGDMHVRRRTVRSVVQAPVEISTPSVVMVENNLDIDADGLERVGAATSVRRPAWQGDPCDVLDAIALSTGTEIAQLRSFIRTRRVAHARRVALLVWTRELDRPAVELARMIGLTSSSASHLIRTASAGALAMAAALGQELRAGGLK